MKYAISILKTVFTNNAKQIIRTYWLSAPSELSITKQIRLQLSEIYIVETYLYSMKLHFFLTLVVLIIVITVVAGPIIKMFGHIKVKQESNDEQESSHVTYTNQLIHVKKIDTFCIIVMSLIG